MTLASGPVTGAVALGAGNDTFLMTGGTLAGAFSAGGGNDTATFRGLTDANLSGVTAIGGNGGRRGQRRAGLRRDDLDRHAADHRLERRQPDERLDR